MTLAATVTPESRGLARDQVRLAVVTTSGTEHAVVRELPRWLRPGDLLLTGSPAGNGAHYGRYLQPGDVMEATITGGAASFGTQHNRCVTP